MNRRTAALCRALLLVVAVCLVSQPSGASAAVGDQGRAQVVKAADAGFDRFTATDAYSAFINAKYWRMRAYSPYFDSRTSWYRGAWSYQNAYAIYPGSSVARDHPDWILKDPQGRKLYIPFACDGGTCPQYAADVGNPAFRAWWLSEARRAMANGYRGLFIDDVNMFLNVGDGTGAQVAPQDVRSGTAMTETTWKQNMVSFLEEIRAGVPDAEIVHNSLWFLGLDDPLIQRQVAAADLIEIERGVNDSGIRGGDWTYGYDTLLSYVDRLHAIGKGVIFDAWGESESDRSYNLASYFLTSNGRDGVSGSGSNPDDWWKGYDVDLGSPRGSRYKSDGLWRRDFANGSVVVNPPDAPTRSFAAAAGTRSTRSQDAGSTIALGAAEGIVVIGPSAPSPVGASAGDSSTFTAGDTAQAPTPTASGPDVAARSASPVDVAPTPAVATRPVAIVAREGERGDRTTKARRSATARRAVVRRGRAARVTAAQRRKFLRRPTLGRRRTPTAGGALVLGAVAARRS